MKDEWKFFLKYSGKQIINEFKKFGKGFRAIFRPKIWFFIFSAILIYQLWHKQSWSAIGALGALFFIWAWDVYVAGAWKHEYRVKTIKSIRKKVLKDMKDKK